MSNETYPYPNWDHGSIASYGLSTFRIKLWEKTTGAIIYDNETGHSDADDPNNSVARLAA